MKRNVSDLCVCSAPNCCDTEQRGGKIIKEMPGSVASGTHCISCTYQSSRLEYNSRSVGQGVWDV